MFDKNRKILAAKPQINENNLKSILSEVEQILRSGQFILGPKTKQFEDMYKDYVGTSYAVAVSTCSAALQIVLRYYDIADQEVIVPANGFPGALSPILYEKGIPVLAEMDQKSFCMDIPDALSRVTDKTKGFIVTHIAGMIQPDLDVLRDYCQQNDLFLIEDASHAHGASIQGKNAGALADAACFSLYPTKNMTTLTGGMITTDSKELRDLALSLRHHGQGTRRNEFLHLASDWCMSEIHAAVGISQLQELDKQIEHRNWVVQKYREKLAHFDWLTIPEHPSDVVHAYYKLPTLLDTSIDRNKLQNMLESEWGVQNGTIYDPPCHLQPVHKERFGGTLGMFPIAEQALSQQFCPPIHGSISEDDIDYVVEALASCIDACRKGENNGSY
jgi:dTDP-4-amino-4,6-dideoxygalactose transaminase